MSFFKSTKKAIYGFTGVRQCVQRRACNLTGGNPVKLSKVMGGWGIWETVNGEQKLTTECIENVIMMVPFSAVVIWNNWRIDVLCGDEGKKVSVKMYEIVIY